jgi:hypothetical protein
MSVKRALFGLFFLLTLASPPVFAGVLLVLVVAASICNLDIALEKWGREARQAQPMSMKFKMSSNICVVGTVMAVFFAVAGAVWNNVPVIPPSALHGIVSCCSIALHFGAIFLFIGSMYTFVKLVD